jgi:fibronectin type 3 domain-containing protein
VDGSPIGTDSSAPFSVAWDSRTSANGAHTLSASAVDLAGNVGASSPVSVTVDNYQDLENPTPPTSLTATPVTAARVNLTWQAGGDNVGVDHYVVLRDAVAVATPVDTNYSDGDVLPQTQYTYTIIAVDAAGNESEPSEPAVAATPPATSSFTFAAAGDHSATPRTSASLAALDASSAEFYLALGDLDYDAVNPDSTWCDYVKNGLPAKGPEFPFELVTGNHEEQGSVEGYILNHTACLPDRLGSVPGPGSVYGAEYLFDYPAADPLMRVLMLPANLTVENVTYTYEVGSPHRAWLVAAIDQARAAGIPWIAVGLHYSCPTTGSRVTCVMGTALWNLLLDKRVDLILTAHEHSYQRSKQLVLDPLVCPSISANVYQAGCIADDGSDGTYPKGIGSVNVIAGTFGRSLLAVNPDDPEAPYFARIDGNTYGFMEYSVRRERIDARFVPTTGTATDAFSIVEGAPAQADVTPPSTATGLVATLAGQAQVDLAWVPSTDTSGIASYAVYRDGVRIGTTATTAFSDLAVVAGASYGYTVRAYDPAGNPSGESAPATVTIPGGGPTLTFTASGDATIRSDAPTANFGTAPTLEVDNSPTHHSLLRFDVTGLTAGRVAKATLKLYCVNASVDGGSAFTISNDWEENTVTWASAPPAGLTPVDTIGPVVTGTWYDVDLTSVVNQDGSYSVRITSSSINGADYHSREGPVSLVPHLVVEEIPNQAIG